MTFDRFWRAYPRKHKKRDAQKAWRQVGLDQAKNELLVDHVIEAVERYKLTRQWQDRNYIPLPATWLRARQWEDELAPGDFVPEKKPEPTARERNEQEARERIERRNAHIAGLAAEAARGNGAHMAAAGDHDRPRAPEPPPLALPSVD